MWHSRHDANAPAHQLTIDIIEGGSSRMQFHNVTDAVRKRPYKLNDLYLLSDLVRETVIAGRISHILEALLDAPPVICNSLTFEYGSQQPDHFDTWYMPSRVLNGMVASWIAIDPVTDTNGPLRYYPGSHKIKPFAMNPEGLTLQQRILARSRDKPDYVQKFGEFREYIDRELKARKIEKPVVFHAQPGDLLIWHSQLFHGGVPITDGYTHTRKALVTHYHSAKDHPDDSKSMVRVLPGRGYYMNRNHQNTVNPSRTRP